MGFWEFSVQIGCTHMQHMYIHLVERPCCRLAGNEASFFYDVPAVWKAYAHIRGMHVEIRKTFTCLARVHNKAHVPGACCRARLELKKEMENLNNDEFNIDDELKKMLDFERQRREKKVRAMHVWIINMCARLVCVHFLCLQVVHVHFSAYVPALVGSIWICCCWAWAAMALEKNTRLLSARCVQ